MVYEAPGGYLVTLRATDNSGRMAETVLNVRVGDPPRVTRLDVEPPLAEAPVEVAFLAEAASSTEGELSYAWDFDGDGANDAEGPETTHVWGALSEPGLKRVLLTVTDSRGVVTQTRRPVTVARYAPLVSALLNAGDVRFVPVADTGTALDGASLTFPVNATNETMTVGISAVPAGDVAVDPPGIATLAMLDLAPAGVSFARPVTVQVPVDRTVEDITNIGVWYFDPAAQAWLDEGLSRIRLAGTDEQPVVAFDTAHFSTFAVTQLAPAGIGPCFIATAAYGSPLAGEIDTLRDWRDTCLLRSAAGAALVDTYYRLSPPLADAVARHPALAASVRVLLTPVVWMVRLGWPALALPGLAALLARTFHRRRRKAHCAVTG